MHIRRFRGRSTTDALNEVRKAFGDDALILSTKKRDGIVEVVAAVDFDLEDMERRLEENAFIKGRLDELKSELSDLRCLFSKVITDDITRDIAYTGNGAIKLYTELVSRGVDKRLSHRLVKAAIAYKGEDMGILERCYSVIRDNTKVCNPIAEGDKPHLFALIGPTGAGKTTTIAKLAGLLSKECNVGIVSIDNKRPGTNEILKEYAREFGVSFAVPKTKREFNKMLWRQKDRDVILIDTPGENPREGKEIDRLKGMLNSGLPIRTGLVLSVTSRDETIVEACRGFGTIPIDCLVFTKIDEAVNYGAILNTFASMNRPVAYLCNGRKVPHDIGNASHDLLGRLILGRR